MNPDGQQHSPEEIRRDFEGGVDLEDARVPLEPMLASYLDERDQRVGSGAIEHEDAELQAVDGL